MEPVLGPMHREPAREGETRNAVQACNPRQRSSSIWTQTELPSSGANTIRAQ